MSVASIQESLLTYTLRSNQLTLDVMNLQSYKELSICEQADTSNLLNLNINEIGEDFKALWESNPELQEKYIDYTEIPEYTAEMNKIQAQFEMHLNELKLQEDNYDRQMTTKNAEHEEVKSIMQSLRNTLSASIKSEFQIDAQS